MVVTEALEQSKELDLKGDFLNRGENLTRVSLHVFYILVNPK